MNGEGQEGRDQKFQALTRPPERAWWSVILERTVPAASFSTLLDVAAVAGRRGYVRIGTGYTNAPNAKNMACEAFLKLSRGDPEAALVLLRSDRVYPPGIVPMLAGVAGMNGFGVVAGLDGDITIKRWALERLRWQGREHFFKHTYPRGGANTPPDEDADFFHVCGRVGATVLQLCEPEPEMTDSATAEAQPQEAAEVAPTSGVYWAVPMEREILADAVQPFLDVGMHAGAGGYTRISVPISDTPTARNRICYSLLATPGKPDDTVVMLDADHAHPADVIDRLAVRPEGVVGALYFRRGPPHDPLFFHRGPDRVLHAPAEWRPFVYPCDAIGTGAIAIKRWVLEKLIDAGHEYFFKYEYPYKAGDKLPSEDIYFGALCEELGIRCHVDCSLVTRHLTVRDIGPEDWQEYASTHPDILSEV